MHFLFGMIGSFLGGVAFGPVNLSVVELTLRRDMQCATRFIAAAAVVELFQAYIAILFGKLIARSIAEIPEFKVLVIVFFLVLGLVFILKKNTPDASPAPSTNGSNFFNGFIVAILNPQAIPYWIFVLSYLKSSNIIHLESWNFALFLIGILGGKFLILSLYSYLSAYIKKRTAHLDTYISKVIGGILLIVGFIQVLNYFFF